ncbi:MAG: hypothetical protein HQ536_02890 [Parcubacteria group bacterium]|nr:hypothetical protein [Parcubacteria group bacterium]
MKIRNTTREVIEKALELTNKEFENNIIFNRFDGYKTFNVTLKCKDSAGKGARRGFQVNNDGSRRKLTTVCWHVHGTFFEKLLELNSETVIIANGQRIDIDGGNWEDRNIGSRYNPLYYSEACDC